MKIWLAFLWLAILLPSSIDGILSIPFGNFDIRMNYLSTALLALTIAVDLFLDRKLLRELF